MPVTRKLKEKETGKNTRDYSTYTAAAAARGNLFRVMKSCASDSAVLGLHLEEAANMQCVLLVLCDWYKPDVKLDVINNEKRTS